MSDEIQFDALQPVPTGPGREVDLAQVGNVPVDLAVEIGRTRMTINETLGLGPGSIVSLPRLAGEPVDLLVNGKPIARGEVVVIDEEFGLRITEIVTPSRRLDAAAGSPEVMAVTASEPAPLPEPEPDFPVEALVEPETVSEA